jgi:hypothetical protein
MDNTNNIIAQRPSFEIAHANAYQMDTRTAKDIALLV